MLEIASSIAAVRMNTICQSQIENIAKYDILEQRDFINFLFNNCCLKN